MFNPITGQEMSTAKTSKVASIILGGTFLTINNTIKAISGGIYDTATAAEKVIRAK